MSTETPTTLTLSAKDPLPFDPSAETQKQAHAQFLHVSLLNNPADSVPPQEVKRLFALRKKYQEQLQEAEANREIQIFDSKMKGKPIPPPLPEIPFPEGLNLDVIRANEPSSASRMYGTYSQNRTERPKSELAQRRPMVHRCPCCNPDAPEPPILKTRPRHGTSHWQVLDEPELPSLPPNVFNKPRKNQPFYYPAPVHASTVGIPLVKDDLLEIRERKQFLFDRYIDRSIAKEKKVRDKTLLKRSVQSREATRKKQQDIMELAHKSGQLLAQSRLTSRHSMKSRTVRTNQVDMDEAEAMNFLTSYDNELWNRAQLARKNDPVSQLLIQESSQPTAQASTLKMPTLKDVEQSNLT